MTRVQEIHDRFLWDQFLQESLPHTFLQSWEWGEFHKTMGGKIWRLGFFDQEKLFAIALILKITARRGSFLFCPHGPMVKNQELKIQNQVLENLKTFLVRLSGEEHCSFFRISSLWQDSEENREIFQRLGFRDAPIHMHSELGWLLCVEPNEEILLSEMRKTMRHAIRDAKKYGAEIFTSSQIEDVAQFDTLYQKTVERKIFMPFSRIYLEKEFEIFAKNNNALLFFGKYNDEIISAAMILFSHSSAFYHHGASDLKYRKIPAAHLLQWEAICEAKRRGCSFYNFWGVSPENKPHHPWAGASFFKKGFGGFLEPYVHAQDFVLHSRYWLTYSIEKIRKIRRGL